MRASIRPVFSGLKIAFPRNSKLIEIFCCSESFLAMLTPLSFAVFVLSSVPLSEQETDPEYDCFTEQNQRHQSAFLYPVRHDARKRR